MSVIIIIINLVFGKAVPKISTWPLIQAGAVRSTFLALALLSLLTEDEITLPVRTPVKAANNQELNLKYLKLIDSFIFNGNVVGKTIPIIRLITKPVPYAKGTLLTNC